MNKLLKELYDWLDSPKQMTRQLIKDKILEINTREEAKKTKAPRVVFTPPTITEIKEYCLIRENNVDAERFYDFYQSKGWLIGKTKMKDWKAAVRTWEKTSNSNLNQNKDGRQQPLLGRQSADTVKSNATGWGNLE
ncbi:MULTISPECIES: hypothetical protein [Flavobacterium]|uniref:Uncharacterized protein n=1 Tax=Flavobacterium keumense TaxID=1306518 RepID=A0ABY8N3I6_9FLAO|nr:MULTISPECIES: hypothetical protein [Flavobacterium]WGK93778.1 hypothetical protein MG292_06655 [Flavobacterium keumense]